MSEDVRKQLRTQGRYSDKLLSSDDKNKGRDRKQKVSPASKVSPESRVPRRNSNENKGTKNPVTDESVQLKYEETSEYKFSQLDDVKKTEQINGRGKRDLSVTENGTSTIYYEPSFLHNGEGWEYFDRLRGSTKWHSKNIVIQGVEYPQPRLVAWYGPFPYTYSGATLEPAEMPTPVKEIKEKVESYLRTFDIDVSFNSVLLNLYRNGKDSVAWHSDDELTMGISPTIASVSLGETRRFEMRQKLQYDEDGGSPDQTAKYAIHLTHGSLIIMTGCMQDDWQHRVPKEYHDKEERINLTFRTVYPLEKVPEHVPAREIKKESSANYSSKTSHHSNSFLDAEDFPPLNSISSPIYPNAKQNVHERTILNSKKGNMNTSVEENWDDMKYLKISEEGKGAEPFDDSKISQNNNKYEQGKIENETSSFAERPVKESTDIDVTRTCKEKRPNPWKSGTPLSANSTKANNCMHEEQPPNPWHKSSARLSANSIRNDDCVHEEKPSNPWHKSDNRVREEKSSNPWHKSDDRVGEKKPSNPWHKSDNRVREEKPSNPWHKSDDCIREEKPANPWHKSDDRVPVNSIRDDDCIGEEKPPNPLHEFDADLDTEKTQKSFCHDETNLSANGTHDSSIDSNNYVESSSSSNINQQNNMDEKTPPKPYLNVNAEEFVPCSVEFVPRYDFSQCDLGYLVSYDQESITKMEEEELMLFSNALKVQIQENSHEFNRFVREELDFLCNITDGSQSVRNQRLISSRICKQVTAFFERANSQRSFDRSSRQRTPYGSQSYHSDRGRKYLNQGRSNNHRY